MADGELRLTLETGLHARLAAAAANAGVSFERYVLDLLADDLDRDPIAVSRARLAEFDRTGEYMTASETLTHCDREVEAALARRR